MVARFSTALAGILIARAVGAEAFGVYAALWAAVLVATSMSEIGLNEGLRRDAAWLPDRLPTLLGNVVLAQCVIGVSALALMYGWSAGTMEGNIGWLYVPLALVGFCNVLQEPIFAAMEVRRQQTTVALIQAARGLAFLLGVILLAFLRREILYFVWCQALAAFLTTLLVCVGPLRQLRVALDLAVIWRQLYTSAVFGLSGILYALYSNLPILLLSRLGTEQQVGYLAVTLRVFGLFFMVGAAASNRAFMPTLFGLHGSQPGHFRDVARLMHRIYIPAGLLVGALLYATAGILVLNILGSDYQPAIPLLRILSLALVLAYCAIPLSAVITTSNHMWTKVAFEAGVTVVGGIVGILAITYYGPVGASWLMVLIWAGFTLLYSAYVIHEKLLSDFTCQPVGIIE